MNEIIKAIADRRSHRAYSPAPIAEEKLNQVLEAGLRSPSAMNKQPWHISVVKNRQLLKDVNEAARETLLTLPEAQRSRRFLDPDYDRFYGAPAVRFISQPEDPFSGIDAGIIVYGMALAAHSLGLGSVVLGLPRLAFLGDKAQGLKRALGFPEGHQFAIALALGETTDFKEGGVPDWDKVVRID